MRKGARVLTWICTFSVLFMGCYTSAMVEPTGYGGDRIYSDDIHSLITKDGTKHEFDLPATLVKNSIVGTVNGKYVSIPLSDVSKVYVTKSNPVGTTLLVVGIIAVAAIVYFSVAVGSAVNGL